MQAKRRFGGFVSFTASSKVFSVLLGMAWVLTAVPGCLPVDPTDPGTIKTAEAKSAVGETTELQCPFVLSGTLDHVSFTWSQVSGPPVTLDNLDKATSGFIPLEAGTYVFEVTVDDGEKILMATITVTVEDKNPTPTPTPTLIITPSPTLTPAPTPTPVPPVVKNRRLVVPKNTAVAIVLKGTGAENAELSFSVVDQPQHGTLSGQAPNLTYTPATDYLGTDSFTYRASAGGLESNLGTVKITVYPPETPGWWSGNGDRYNTRSSFAIGPQETPGVEWKVGTGDWTAEWNFTSCGNKIFLNQAGSPDFLSAYDLNGHLLWSNDTLAEANAGTIGLDGTLYVRGGWGLIALNPDDGSEKWSKNMYFTFLCNFRNIIGSDGTLYTGGGPTQAWNPDGTVKWQLPIAGYSLTAGYQNTLFFTDRSDVRSTSSLICVNTQDGSTAWQVLLPETILEIVASPQIVLAGTFSNLYGFDPSTGQLKWKMTNMPATSGNLEGGRLAVGHDGTLYVNTLDGIEALDPSDGSVLWSSGIHGFASIVDGLDTLYTTDEHYLYALDPDGNIKWTMPHENPLTLYGMAGDGTLFGTSNEGSWNYYVCSIGLDGKNPPVAEDQTVTTGKNQSIEIQVQGHDPAGSSLTYVLGDLPSHGLLRIDGWPKVVYTPSPDFVGEDSFTFKVSNGLLWSGMARVTIKVGP